MVSCSSQHANGAIPQTINAVSTDPGPQPSPALRDNHTRASRSVLFRVPDRKSKVTERRTDQQDISHGNNDTESFHSSLPSTVPETMDEALIDNLEAAEIEADTEDREAHGQDTQFSNATQPISQTVYDDVIRRSRSEPRSLHSDLPPQDIRVNDAELDEEEDEDLENSIQEGDSNFVDICSSFVPVPDAINSAPIDISPTQTQHEFTQFRESQRFKTPATAGKKRDHAGNFIETPVESRNPFARGGKVTPGNVVGLSQAFANTQAASSPLPAVPTSELRSDKPSPGLSVERNVKGLPTSSPLQMLSDIRRPSEPAARYVPVRQSQALRQAFASNVHGIGETQESMTDGFDSVMSTVQRRKIASEREREARRQMEAASSPTSPDERDAIQIADPPVRAASERPANVVRSKSKSRSLPSSPPAIETEETTEEIEGAEVENDSPAGKLSQLLSEGITQPSTSSASLRNRQNVTTLVPNTTKRATRSTARPSHKVQPSPSERRIRIETFAEPESSNPIRVANSQRSIPFTQDPDPGIALSTADSIDVIPASPEGHLQSTEPSGFHDYSIGQNPSDDGTKDDADEEDHVIESTDQLKSGTVDKSSITETDSDMLMQKQKSNTYTTAPTNQRQDTNITAMEWSSQPVRNTPPGRKRKRLGEISQEDLVPAATQSSAFDPAEVLAIDPNFGLTNPVVSQDPDPIRSRKRTRLHSPVAVEDEVRQEPAPPAVTANSANIGRQLRNKHVIVDEDDQGAENAAPSSSLSDLPVTPSTVKTPTKKLSASKSIYSPVESPQPRTAPAVVRSGTQAARAGLQEIASGRNRRVVSKSTLKTPKTNPTPLLPIQESSPDPLAINAVQTVISMPAPPTHEVVAPQMIFAYFMGTKRTYYPAICKGYSTEKEKFTIVWPGYDAELMDQHGVCSLDLRIGDEVRVDREGWPKNIWRIRDFGPIEPIEEGSSSLRDIYGHTTCLLEPKDSKLDLRKLVPKNDPVAIEHIYLDSNQFTRFKKRPFRYSMTETPQPLANMPRPSTPPVRTSTPSTPSSRGRNPVKEETSIQPALRHGIFSNMVFAITTKVETDHPEVADIVRNHGGIILRSNFQELVTEDTQVRPTFKDLSFAALLADRHSRSEKYLQALALGLPCLSWKWVEASTRREKLVSWQDYLLPAGESIELDAVRSRILPAFDVTRSRLAEIIDMRPRFFTDSNAIFVTGRGKVEVQRKTYLFFTRVMGLTSTERVPDLAAAKLQLAGMEKKGKTWLVVDDKDYDAALHIVRSIKNASAGSKKKKTVTDSGWECRVADKEFLVQSLILGRLCERDCAT